MSTYMLFPTGVGPCGLAWGPNGIVGVQLPESNASKTLARLLHRLGGDASPGQAPPDVQQVIDDIVALLDGERRNLQYARLDMDRVPELFRRIYAVVRRIPAGQTLSYGEVATRCGDTDARTVGQAMARNPFPIVVPCHRVAAANGKGGGFSAYGGVTTKLRLLALEGAGTLSLPW
ncbi:MAG TPA: methylated-DNA--[protein]-cysteine S-methyltransferase [Steroidobacteraceae bacterium]|nr:methylated-DNA--[protein]-cysteine S-methyltransferase [Steroidobacteraceae bacterium]